MTLSLDTNILVYAYQSSDPAKQVVAMDCLQKISMRDCNIAGQVLSEFMNTGHKKRLISLDLARQACRILEAEFAVCEQNVDDRINASKLSESRKIQFYDALLISTLARSGVKILLSEDLADGDTYDGVRVLNPFNPANAARIEAALH